MMRRAAVTTGLAFAAVAAELAARRLGPSGLGSFWYPILLSVGASAVGAMAAQRGRSRIGFALLSFVFTSPVTLAGLFALRVRVQDEDESADCNGNAR